MSDTLALVYLVLDISSNYLNISTSGYGFSNNVFSPVQTIRICHPRKPKISSTLSYYKVQTICLLMKLYNNSSDIPKSLMPWISELESLGIKSEKLNELNDVYEVKNLVENIKQTFYQDFKSSYQKE